MRLVLLGDPVEHSLSPVLHAAAMEAAGIDGTYETRRVDEAGLRSAMDEVRYGVLDGANITMPHKEAAFRLADHHDEAALRTGAVNTLVGGNGAVRGANTDIDGVLFAVAEAGIPADAPVMILGAGGAAAAALVALAGRHLTVAARRPEAARLLCTRTRIDADVVAWGTVLSGVVVVNATPVGMHGERLPAGIVAACVGLVEMPYASGRTPAESEAAAAGIPVAGGVEMLLGQATQSFRLWTGVEPSAKAMRSALTRSEGSQAAI